MDFFEVVLLAKKEAETVGRPIELYGLHKLFTISIGRTPFVGYKT